MYNRRNILKLGLLTSLGSTLSTASFATETARNTQWKNWIWIHPNAKEESSEIRKKYKAYKAAGITGILFESDSEKHFREAKSQGLEAHRWNWTMNKGAKELLEKHPDWYAVSRDGKSCAVHPPYVGYYRWLCPSKQEVIDYLSDEAGKILAKDYIDGLHLDYIRYCDVILPLNLWSNYKIEQRMELAEYDFCYCSTCREKFKSQHGKDPLLLEFPDASLSWRLFRYEAINHVVNTISLISKRHKKSLTAAVFPTPEVARRIVRQDWTNWNLNGVFPMIYHGFYQEEVQWIGEAVKEGVHFLHNQFPLYAGLYLPDFQNNMNNLSAGITYALKNGAAGISLFGNVTQDVLDTLKKTTETIRSQS